MQAPIRCAVVAGMLLGCDAGHTNTPPDADASVDPGPSGLVIEWSTSPSTLPGTANNVTVNRARFALDRLRVVGDAGPGDPRTTATTVEMCFQWTSQCTMPETITFDDAPTGLYSQVALVFDGHDAMDSYEIRGSVVVDGDSSEFRIEDRIPLAFNVAIDEMVSPGESALVKLRINFMHALDSLDWKNVDKSDGRYEIDEGDSEIVMFRTKLIESFEIDKAGSSGAR